MCYIGKHPLLKVNNVHWKSRWIKMNEDEGLSMLILFIKSRKKLLQITSKLHSIWSVPKFSILPCHKIMYKSMVTNTLKRLKNVLLFDFVSQGAKDSFFTTQFKIHTIHTKQSYLGLVIHNTRYLLEIVGWSIWRT